MCKLKSAIVLKDRVYVPDHDRHTHMLEELKIADTGENAERLFVRVELVPPNGDVFTDVDLWTLDVDQDIRPDWFFEEIELPKVKEAVKAWAKERIFLGVDNLVLSSGAGYYLKDCHNVTLSGTANVSELRGTSEGWMSGNSKVGEMFDTSKVGEMYDNSKVGEMYDTSKVGEMFGTSKVRAMFGNSSVGAMFGTSSVGVMYGNSKVGAMSGTSSVGEMFGTSSVDVIYSTASVGRMRDNSKVGEMRDTSKVGEMRDNSKVGEMFGTSSVLIANHQYSEVNASKIILLDNATIRDARTKTIYQAGDWKLVNVNV